LKKFFWIGIAAAAAAAIACGGGGSDGPNAREQLGAEVAQFGHWEILVHGFHDTEVIEQRRVFRDVYVLPASQMTLYISYLDAYLHASDVLGLPGADSARLNNARNDFREARREVERQAEAYRGVRGWPNPTLRRDGLHAAIHRALTEDMRTVSFDRLNDREIPNEFFDWQGEMRFNETAGPANDGSIPGRVGARAAVPFPLQRILMDPAEQEVHHPGAMQANFIVDTPHVRQFHQWISGSLNVFLNRYWEDSLGAGSWSNVLTQQIIDDATRSLNDATNVLVGIRRLREGSLTAALGPVQPAGGLGAVGSTMRPVVIPNQGRELPENLRNRQVVQITTTAVNIPANSIVDWLPVTAMGEIGVNGRPSSITTGAWTSPAFSGIEPHGGHMGGVQIRFDHNATLGGAAGPSSAIPRRELVVVAAYTPPGGTVQYSNPIAINMVYHRVFGLAAVTAPAYVTSSALNDPDYWDMVEATIRPGSGNARQLTLRLDKERMPEAPVYAWEIWNMQDNMIWDSESQFVTGQNWSLQQWGPMSLTLNGDNEEMVVNVPHTSAVGITFRIRAIFSDPDTLGDDGRPVTMRTNWVEVRIRAEHEVQILNTTGLTNRRDPLGRTVPFILIDRLTSTALSTAEIAAGGFMHQLNAITDTGVRVNWSVAPVAAYPGNTLGSISWASLVNGQLLLSQDATSGSVVIRATKDETDAYADVEVRWNFLTLQVPQDPVSGNLTHTNGVWLQIQTQRTRGNNAPGNPPVLTESVLANTVHPVGHPIVAQVGRNQGAGDIPNAVHDENSVWVFVPAASPSGWATIRIGLTGHPDQYEDVIVQWTNTSLGGGTGN
jgi:hypothetical protein